MKSIGSSKTSYVEENPIICLNTILNDDFIDFDHMNEAGAMKIISKINRMIQSKN